MTVGDLIERLNKLDHTRRVILQGFEGGFDDLCNIDDWVQIELDWNEKKHVGGPAWYFGLHGGPDSDAPSEKLCTTVLLWSGRGSRDRM